MSLAGGRRGAQPSLTKTKETDPMTITYRPLLLPLAVALLSTAVGCSGSDAEAPGDGTTTTSSRDRKSVV